MLSDITPEELKGTAVAVFRFVGDLGIMIGPLVAGFASEHLGFPEAFAISAVPIAFAVALVASTGDTRPMLPKTGEAAGL
jgi:MFS family permease